MSFDARAAKLLKPGQHIILDESPGLRLEASATCRTWTYRYKSPLDARMRQASIGHWPAVSHAGATVEWEKLRALRDAGRDPALERKAARAQARAAEAPATAITVRQVCKLYKEGHLARNRKEQGRHETVKLLDAATESVAELAAEQLTRSQAFTLLEAYLDRGPTARRLRSELGAAWDYAIDAGKLPQDTPNWWRLIMRGKLRSKGKKINGKPIGTVKRVLSATETGVLINWLPNFTRLVDDALTMYLWTCTRGAEIVQMERHEIVEESDGLWWIVPKSKTKNARHENATDLRVPLVGRAELVVRRRLASIVEGTWLFPADGVEGPIEQKTIQTAVYKHQPYCQTQPKQIRPRLTVTHWSPHALRRTGRTLLAALGCPQEVGEAIIGHMPPEIVGIYNLHQYDAERRLWLTRLSERYEQLAREQVKRL